MTAVPFEVGQGTVDFGGRHHGHGGWDTKDAVWNAASRSDAASAVETRDLAKAQSDGVAVTGDRIGNVSRELCASMAATAKNTCDIEKSIASASYAGATATQLWGQTNQNNTTAGFAAINLAVEKTAAALQTSVEKTAAAGLLEAVRNAGAAALAAATNTAAIQAQAAECCCELRTAIAAEGEKTRALVSQIDRERLQARLATLEGRLLQGVPLAV